MTSAAKRNHERVLHICEEMDWFGRSEECFRLVQQDLVPVVTTVCGQWRINASLEPELKPGGHGVLWKLARDKGVFRWFKENKREAAIVRQISNPMAGTDSTLLALGGMGHKQKKLTALELIDESDPDTATKMDAGADDAGKIHFHVPAGPDLSNDEELAQQAANWGLEALPFTAEMLGLVDEVTGESLPAALLPYCGRSMLEGLIRDLEAREYLYY
eukprot:gene17688-21074_t